MCNVRVLALDLLVNVEQKKAFSNIEVNKKIMSGSLSKRDSALFTELTYGTIQRKLTLDYYLAPFLPKKIEIWVKCLLRMSVYQMCFLDKIPAHAIVSEAVTIAKRRGHRGVGALVNGVLRNIGRQKTFDTSKILDDITRLSIETSHPLWLVSMWLKQFGYSATEKMAKINLIAPKQTARVNLTKTSRNKLIDALKAENFDVLAHPFMKECIENSKGNLAKSSFYKLGLMSIQDVSSMLVGEALNPLPNENILDCCSAPGGKTAHILEKTGGKANVFALDIHKKKLRLALENAVRLGFLNLETRACDARSANKIFPSQYFDRILVDAPCSGLGVLRRKPDAKYSKTIADIKKLATIQLDILQAVAPLVKTGGMICYSTCTVNRLENEDVVEKFLQNNSEFVADKSLKSRLPKALHQYVVNGHIQILPQYSNSDGFFIASIIKQN